jgi:hypothetical protein
VFCCGEQFIRIWAWKGSEVRGKYFLRSGCAGDIIHVFERSSIDQRFCIFSKDSICFPAFDGRRLTTATLHAPTMAGTGNTYRPLMEMTAYEYPPATEVRARVPWAQLGWRLREYKSTKAAGFCLPLQGVPVGAPKAGSVGAGVRALRGGAGAPPACSRGQPTGCRHTTGRAVHAARLARLRRRGAQLPGPSCRSAAATELKWLLLVVAVAQGTTAGSGLAPRAVPRNGASSRTALLTQPFRSIPFALADRARALPAPLRARRR